MSCRHNRQDSPCALFGSTPCYESGFIPVDVPINRPTYIYEENSGDTTYYGSGKPCCSAPGCGLGNCNHQTRGGCNDVNSYRKGNDLLPRDIDNDAEYRHSIGYARINQPRDCYNDNKKQYRTDKCGLNCKAMGGDNLKKCGFCNI
jgi:hypothetical protein